MLFFEVAFFKGTTWAHCVKPGEKAVTVGRVTFFGVGETVRFGDIGTVVRTGAPLFVR